MAHNGVLFLDELPEFPQNVLEVLRQPLEDRRVTIARASMTLTFPASFVLIAAMNPCPCGFANDFRRECFCTPPQIQRYMSKISGPLMDRINIQVDGACSSHRSLPETTNRRQTCSRGLYPVFELRTLCSFAKAKRGLEARDYMPEMRLAQDRHEGDKESLTALETEEAGPVPP